ncbi:hypothetical protein ACEPAF_4083 [Sanghuangporus sanghuang]
MVKRELVADPKVDLNSPRSKRHKDGEAGPSSKDGGSIPPEREESSDHEEGNSGNVAGAMTSMSPEEVREEGLKVLQVLKDAVNKEGRQISYDFLRLPSKRQFPDYYEIIKQPVALDDIKSQLENHAYASLEALREELDTCFRNAKRYNQRESVIWKDAKTLQKLANKELDKIIRKGKEDDEGSDKEGGKKKEKGVNIHRLMKNRLLKLVAKTDESERKLSDPFMELPSKKKWAIYYKLISRPICLEDIFKRIKRKEYHTIPDFINDVDLVFLNAMSFNEDHSPIWEDALALKTYFHQIMTDLPAKYNMNGTSANSSASAEGSHTRIRLKLPGHHPVTHSISAEVPDGGESSAPTARLRVPGGSGPGASGVPSTATSKDKSVTPEKKAKAASPTAPATALPSASSIPYSTHTSTSPPTAITATPGIAMPTPKLARAAVATAQAKLASVAQTPSHQQQTPAYTPFQQYTTPNQVPAQNFYAPPAPTTATPVRASTTPAPSASQPAVTTGRADAPSPVPPASAAGLYSVRLECCPPSKSEMRRRLAILDTHAGVRNFALRISIVEAKLVIRSVKFALHDADGDEGSDEEESKVVRTPSKKRGRGRPKKVVPIDQEVKPPDVQQEIAHDSAIVTAEEKRDKGGREWRFATSSEVEIKLDGRSVTPGAKDVLKVTNVLVNGNAEASPGSVASERPAKPEDEWSVDLTVGQHVLEISRKGNSVPWKVYLSVS